MHERHFVTRPVCLFNSDSETPLYLHNDTWAAQRRHIRLKYLRPSHGHRRTTESQLQIAGINRHTSFFLIYRPITIIITAIWLRRPIIDIKLWCRLHYTLRRTWVYIVIARGEKVEAWIFDGARIQVLIGIVIPIAKWRRLAITTYLHSKTLIMQIIDVSV